MTAEIGCAYGVLKVGPVEVAIPAASLQEVVVCPGGVTPRPLAAPYVLGTFNLRGMAVPTVDLRLLLAVGDPAVPRTGTEKVVVLRHAAGRLGLVVDAVSDVLRLLPAQLCRLAPPATALPPADGRPALIPQVFMADGGARIVHVLDLDALVAFPDVLLAFAGAVDARVADAGGRLRQYLMFRCDDLGFCIDATAVREIIDAPAIERSFLSNGLYLGSVRVRGQSVPAVSLPRLLGIDRQPDGTHQLLVMELEGQPLGLMISRVVAISKRREGEVLSLPGFGLARSALYAGVMPDAGPGMDGDALLLRPAALARHEEISPLVRLHATLYDDPPQAVSRLGSGAASRAGQAGQPAAPGGIRQLYLSYGVGMQLSSPLGHIDEIIEFPERLIRPGTQDGLLAGMLNRRGTMTPLVDLGRLLGQVDRDWSVRPKVLVVRGERISFGLIVDSVNNIEVVGPDQTAVPAGQVAPRPGAHPMIAGLMQLVMVEGGSNKRSMALLDLAALAGMLEAECAPAAPPDPEQPAAPVARRFADALA